MTQYARTVSRCLPGPCETIRKLPDAFFSRAVNPRGWLALAAFRVYAVSGNERMARRHPYGEARK